MADNFVTDDGRGWREFTSEIDETHRYPRSVITAQRSVVEEKWWRDMLYLSKTTAFIDSQTTQPSMHLRLNETTWKSLLPTKPNLSLTPHSQKQHIERGGMLTS